MMLLSVAYIYKVPDRSDYATSRKESSSRQINFTKAVAPSEIPVHQTTHQLYKLMLPTEDIQTLVML